jgi:tRNA dimethylallyltransferase
MQQLIVIEGATASGKTGLGVELAKALNTVVLSADSRQFYRELAIGTAKPTAEEMQGIPHYFVDSHSIHDPVTSARFEQEAMALLQTELKDREHIVVVGGSGMFIDALCIGLDPIPTDGVLQERLRTELQEQGIEPLLAELAQKDPDYFKTVDTGNPARVLRALEVFRLTGKPFSEWRKNKPAPRPFLVQRFVIEHPREQLYDRINQRVDQMMTAGLLDEARSVSELRHLAPLQTVGYTECFAYVDGTTDLATCVDKIKQHTRNYAKRQLTWFRRHPESVWLAYTTNAEMVKAIRYAIR